MDKENLEEFLSVQGIAGIALLNRKNRSYFHRSFASLDKRQQDALQEGLFQVLDTMPSGFDFFDFQFAQQRIFVYPLTPDSVLIVGVDDEHLDLPIYTEEVAKIRTALLEDPALALTTFRFLATQRETTTSSRVPPKTTPAVPTGIPTTFILAAMNHLGQVTHSYLGKAVVVNYWKTTRSEMMARSVATAELLAQFDIDRSGEVRYMGSLAQLNLEQIKMIRAWVEAFVKRCEDVIRDFRSLLRTENLTPEERKLLL